MNQSNDMDTNCPETDLETFQKGGSAGSKGVDFQLGLLSVGLLNAFKLLKGWKLSTENKAAGKFDDLVLECPDGNVLLQAKHRENQEPINMDDFMSTRSNGTFSLPKYFQTYVQGKFKEPTSIVICTNADVKLKEYLKPANGFSKSILHYPDATCSFYRFKYSIINLLKSHIRDYYRNNEGNGNKINDENIKEFLDNLQICCKYPTGVPLENAIEQILSLMSKYSKSPHGHVSYLEIHVKVKEWFQRKGEVHYLNDIRTKAMFFDIWKDKYFKKLNQYNVSFRSHVRRSLEPKGIFHFVADGKYLSQELRLFEEFKAQNNVLYLPSDINTEIRDEIIEVFKLKQYNTLLIVFPKTVIISESLQQTVNESKNKTVILLSDLPHYKFKKIQFTSNFQQISPQYRKKFLNMEVINFQGHRITLKALFGTTTSNTADKLGSEALDKLIKNEEIRVGLEIAPLEPCYVDRKFNRHGVVHTEDSICEIPEKVILISDEAGYGKTSVLKKLQKLIKDKYPNLWVIRIEEYPHMFRNIFKLEKYVDIAQLLQLNDVEQLVFSIEKKVVLMIDAVDKINSDIILNLLVQCRQAANFKKIFVSARPHITEELEKWLEIDRFNIIPGNEIKVFSGAKYPSSTTLRDLKLEFRKDGFNIADLSGKTPLHYAAESGEVEIAKLLVEKGANVNCLDFYRENPLHKAAHGGHLDMVKYLIEEKVNVNSLNCDEASPLSCACKKGHIIVAEFLIEKGADVNTSNLHGNTLLHEAALEGDLEMVQYLIDKKVNVNSLNSDKTSPLHNACMDGRKNVVQLLVQNRADINSSDMYGNTPLHRAANWGHFTVAQYLIEKKVNVNSLNDAKHSPLYYACMKGHIDVVELLIQNRADINSADINGNTPLHRTAYEGHFKVVEYLIQEKVNVNSLNDTKRSPLHNACAKGHIDIVQLLIQNRADINSADMDGNTPLHLAAYEGHLKVVKYLIAEKVNVNSLNNDLYSPLHIARREGHIDIVDALRCPIDSYGKLKLL